jgi:hypothetical protein
MTLMKAADLHSIIYKQNQDEIMQTFFVKFSLLQCAIILSNTTVPIDIAEYVFYEVRKYEGGKDETD